MKHFRFCEIPFNFHPRQQQHLPKAYTRNNINIILHIPASLDSTLFLSLFAGASSHFHRNFLRYTFALWWKFPCKDKSNVIGEVNFIEANCWKVEPWKKQFNDAAKWFLYVMIWEEGKNKKALWGALNYIYVNSFTAKKQTHDDEKLERFVFMWVHFFLGELCKLMRGKSCKWW